jgi:hypothetical protein
MSMDVDKYSVTLHWEKGVGLTYGPMEFRVSDPDANEGTLEKKGGSLPFKNPPAFNPNATFNQAHTALLNAAKTQEGIPT